MKMKNRFVVMVATIAAASACALLSQPASAQITVFDDTFSPVDGNTVDQSPVAPTATSASYEIASNTTNKLSASISSGDFNLVAANTSSTFIEAMAQFTNSVLTLANVGDYIDVTVTFKDTLAILRAGDGSSQLQVGLFNSGSTAPLQGALLLNSNSYPSGGAMGWHGYYGRITATSGTGVYGREPQLGSNGKLSAVQDLLFNNASSGIAFNDPVGNSLGTASPGTVSLTQASTYTDELRITITGVTSIDVTNTLLSGGIGGTPLYTTAGTTNGLSSEAFDALAFGWRFSGTATNSTMDVSEIKITTDVPEPSTIMLVGAGFALAIGLIRRRRS